MTDIMSDRRKKIILSPGLMVCPFLGPMLMQEFLFLNYINDLSDGLSSNAKLFADDTSLFSVVHNMNASAIELRRYDTIKTCP